MEHNKIVKILEKYKTENDYFYSNNFCDIQKLKDINFYVYCDSVGEIAIMGYLTAHTLKTMLQTIKTKY